MPSLSSAWQTFSPAIADHLWQSTLFSVVAALLALLLRNNSARIRYSLWLAASLKFLLPFSFLVALGAHLSWRHALVPFSSMYAVEVVAQPFSQALPDVARAAPLVVASAQIHWLPLLLGTWLCGFIIVLLIWAARWWRVSALVRHSIPFPDGRELSALRRTESLVGTKRPLCALFCRTSLEPGVFGIFQPVLLWPPSISERLDDAQLEAVVAHELFHVRRRDNLAAALHMWVEAIFWFHPLVWWIGARLIEERERACDEAVIELGSGRKSYAESILKVCEFCLSSPLTCVSGVTGSDLKKRMVHIMTDAVVRKLNLARRLLLWTAACLAIALPLAFGLFQATPGRAESPSGGTPRFASVSITPHASDGDGLMMTKMMMNVMPAKAGDVPGYVATGVSVHSLIQSAYKIQETQLTGEPDWVKTQRYDINATIDPSVVEQIRNASHAERDLVGQLMLQQLLADHFKLQLRQQSVDLPVYELIIGEGGSKLQKTAAIGMTRMNIAEIIANGAPLSILTSQLSQRLGRTVVDKTGLKDSYAFTLRWTPDADEIARIRAAGLPPQLAEEQSTTPTASAPPLLTAVQEQLGLKLQPETTRVPVLVVDHVEPPVQN